MFMAGDPILNSKDRINDIIEEMREDLESSSVIHDSNSQQNGTAEIPRNFEEGPSSIAVPLDSTSGRIETSQNTQTHLDHSFPAKAESAPPALLTSMPRPHLFDDPCASIISPRTEKLALPKVDTGDKRTAAKKQRLPEACVHRFSFHKNKVIDAGPMQVFKLAANKTFPKSTPVPSNNPSTLIQQSSKGGSSVTHSKKQKSSECKESLESSVKKKSSSLTKHYNIKDFRPDLQKSLSAGDKFRNLLQSLKDVTTPKQK